MLINCAFDNVILEILIISRFLFISFFRRSLIAISNDFILYIDDIRLAKIIIFMILAFLKTVVYEARRYSNVNKNYKDHRFIYNRALHLMLKLVFLCSIENISKVIIWNSNHVNLVNDNVIEMNFDDLLFEVLHLFFVREFHFININSVDFRTHSLCMELINVYDLNKKIRFRKYINLRCVFDWCSFVWLIHKNVYFQSCDDSRC